MPQVATSFNWLLSALHRAGMVKWSIRSSRGGEGKPKDLMPFGVELGQWGILSESLSYRDLFEVRIGAGRKREGRLGK